MDVEEFEHVAKMAIGGVLTIYYAESSIYIGRQRDASYFTEVKDGNVEEEKHPRHVITTVARVGDYVLIATGRTIVHIDPARVVALAIHGLPDVGTVLEEARERLPGLYL